MIWNLLFQGRGICKQKAGSKYCRSRSQVDLHETEASPYECEFLQNGGRHHLGHSGNGWESSLEKAPLFTRAQMDRHIVKSGKHIGGDKHAHHSVPTGFKKAKTYLEDEYLHDIHTNFDQQYSYNRCKCFHSFKRNESPHNLIFALCLISGEVVYANCGPSCAAGKSRFSFNAEDINKFFYIPYLTFFIILHRNFFVYFIIYVREREFFIKNSVTFLIFHL